MLITTKAKSTVTRKRNPQFYYKRKCGTGKALDLKNLPSIRSRQMRLKTVERVAEARLPTEFGEFRIVGFRSLASSEEFVVLVKGELRPDRTLFRSQSFTHLRQSVSQCVTVSFKTLTALLVHSLLQGAVTKPETHKHKVSVN